MAAPGAGDGKKARLARCSPASAWAVIGVAAFLSNGLRRVLPAALLPFHEGLSFWGWVAYVLTGVFFAYAEGYRGFQQRFSPLVVSRAFLLDTNQPPVRQVLAPLYAMAFFHAKRKRKVMSYALIFGIFAVVALVKRLPYPYRSILDGGVCIGLAWGIGSMLALFVRSLSTGRAPDVDPCLPEP
mmetsp:Transcript_104806/g.313103  ORF Transcript_104806/g.313103 Transcript_104806/m.313103 type:complete len:184 (+) Transcript_104806:77-628(+)